MQTPNEMRAKIVGKASEDADFRARLLDDPKAAIGQELGVAVPSSLTIEVHEEGRETAHLVLPLSSHLAEPDLGIVAGGFPSTEGSDSWRDYYKRDW